MPHTTSKSDTENSLRQGGCHCQAVQYEVEMDLLQTMTCNCSHCSKQGFIMAFVPATRFTLLSGEDVLSEYRFGAKTLAYFFCKICGTESFARGGDREGNAMVMINVRCLDGVDLTALHPAPFDGKSM